MVVRVVSKEVRGAVDQPRAVKRQNVAHCSSYPEPVQEIVSPGKGT